MNSPNFISTGLVVFSLKPLGLICPGPSRGGDDLSGLLGGLGVFSLRSLTSKTLVLRLSWRVETALEPTQESYKGKANKPMHLTCAIQGKSII